MKNKTFYAVVGILVITTVIALGGYFTDWTAKGNEAQVSVFPLKFGEWEGKNYPVDKRTYEILETHNLFIRDYKNTHGDSIILYVVYSKDNRKALHPPEICITGGGLEILEKTPVQVTSKIRAVKLLTEEKERRELVVYWFKAGELSTDVYIKQQLKTVFDHLMGKQTSGAMIRVSAQVKNNDEEAATNLVRSFCMEIEPLIEQYVP
jgi:EpsI family protein